MVCYFVHLGTIFTQAAKMVSGESSSSRVFLGVLTQLYLGKDDVVPHAVVSDYPVPNLRLLASQCPVEQIALHCTGIHLMYEGEGSSKK